MAAKNTTIIRFPRCREIQSSRQHALIHLTEDINHIVGQPVIVSYYTDLSKTSIDTMLAMGIKNGKGKDCFSIIHTGQFIVVDDVVYSVPDVSSLVHEEIYLFNNVNGSKAWYLVYSEDGIHRTLEELDERPRFYINLKDNSIWVSGSDCKARPLYEIYTRAEVDALIEQIKIDTDFERIEEKLDEAIEKSNFAYDKVLELEEEIQDIEIGTESIDTIARLHSNLEVKLVRINGEPADSTWFDTMNGQVAFPTGALEFELIYHNYDGTDITYEHFSKVTFQIDGEEWIDIITPNEDGYFTNPTAIVLRSGEDMRYSLIFGATYDYNKIEIKDTIDISGIRGSKYHGRIDDIQNINLASLTRETEYDWESLKSIKLNIPEGNFNKFVYLYPSAWGELSEIYSGGLSYYRQGSSRATFSKTTITFNETEFNAYIYRNENGEEADNVIFD